MREISKGVYYPVQIHHPAIDGDVTHVCVIERVYENEYDGVVELVFRGIAHIGEWRGWKTFFVSRCSNPVDVITGEPISDLRSWVLALRPVTPRPVVIGPLMTAITRYFSDKKVGGILFDSVDFRSTPSTTTAIMSGKGIDDEGAPVTMCFAIPKGPPVTMQTVLGMSPQNLAIYDGDTIASTVTYSELGAGITLQTERVAGGGVEIEAITGADGNVYIREK